MFKRLFYALVVTFLLGSPAFAKAKVVTAYPYIEDLVKQIAGNQVEIASLASGQWDPHFVIAKPSLVARLRRADLLIINGAQLEVGWLPPLLRQANNAKIQPGNAGFLELENFVDKIQIPQNVSRAMGDVHPQGNPHFVLDPHNIPKMTDVITQKLCQLENTSCAQFQANNRNFKQRWSVSSKKWAQRMLALKEAKVVEYHRLHDYFIQSYGLNLRGTLEPLPGIPPSPQHLAKIIAAIKSEKILFNIRGVYNPNDPSNYVSRQTPAKEITLPHDVGAVPEAKDIFTLYESLLTRLGV